MGRKKTHDIFVLEFNLKHKGEFTVAGRYTSATEKLLFKHEPCGTEFSRKASEMLHKSKTCPKCAVGQEKWTVEKFLKVLPIEYELLSDFVTPKIKAQFRHKVCGRVWSTIPQMFISGHGCKPCSSKASRPIKTDAEFNKDLIKNNPTFISRSDYKGAHTPMFFECLECRYEFSNTPDRMINKKVSCPSCGVRRTWTTESFAEYVQEETGGEYSLLSDFQTLHHKHTFRHETCRREYESVANSFKNGHRCPHCASEKPIYNLMSTDDFVERISMVHDNEITLISDYLSTSERMRVKHIVCGLEWDAFGSNLLRGNGCPKCASSKGEKAIREKLASDGYSFIEQATEEGLRHRALLRFDFKVTNADGSYLYIEFDGKQHYEAVDFFGGVPAFELIKTRDTLKNEYCRVKGIPLIRIPYWEFYNGTLETFLETQLNNILEQKIAT